MSYQTVNEIPVEHFWALDYKLTTTASGGGTLTIDISPGKGNRMILKYCRVRVADLSGDKTVTLDVRDKNTQGVGNIAALGMDNESFWFPALGAVIGAENAIAKRDGILIVGTDFLRVNTGAFAQNEWVQIVLRALVLKQKPTISPAGSGTETVTETYNEYI